MMFVCIQLHMIHQEYSELWGRELCCGQQGALLPCWRQCNCWAVSECMLNRQRCLSWCWWTQMRRWGPLCEGLEQHSPAPSPPV